MQTKLTLRVDEELVRRAKEHARRSGKSVSRIVADFLALLEQPTERQVVELTPTVRSLLGALKGNPVGEEDYRRYLEEKYR
jgi:predicted transcriptional regulator